MAAGYLPAITESLPWIPTAIASTKVWMPGSSFSGCFLLLIFSPDQNLPFNNSFCFPLACLCLLLLDPLQNVVWLRCLWLWLSTRASIHDCIQELGPWSCGPRMNFWNLQTSSLLLACEKCFKGNSCLWSHDELLAVLEMKRGGYFSYMKKRIWKMAQSEKAQPKLLLLADTPPLLLLTFK